MTQRNSTSSVQLYLDQLVSPRHLPPNPPTFEPIGPEEMPWLGPDWFHMP